MDFAKAIRAGTVTLLVIILCVIMGYFITRSKKRPEISVKSDEITQKKIEKKEQVKHSEFKGQKGSFQIRADRHYVGEDNWNHLEGNVKIVFFKKREGEDVFLYGDEVIYDSDWSHFQLSGKVRVEFKDLVIESPVLNYSSKKDSFWSYRGVNFSSEKLTCSAQRVDYLMKEEKIKLQKNVRLQIKLNLETPLPLVAEGDSLVYSRGKRQGIMEGGVGLYHGTSHGKADLLRFDLFPDEENVRSVYMKGNVHAFLVREGSGNDSPQSQSSVFSQSERREIKAEEIEILAFQGIPEIQSVAAGGDCAFKFISSSGSYTLFQAERIKFVFDLEGELKEFYGSKNARMVEQGAFPEKKRVIVGNTMAMKDKSNILRVRGNKQSEARITLPESEITAGELVIFFNNRNLEAREGVKIILRSSSGEKKSIGFFSNEEPVFVVAREMRYFDEEERSSFHGNIKIWQEKKTLFGEEANLYEDTGKILCTGGVRSVFPHESEDEEEEEENIEISARSMRFNPEEDLVVYEEDCSLKIKDVHLRSQTVTVHLGKKGGGGQRIVSQGEVVIVQNQSEGRGEVAEYDPQKKTMVLLGNPVLKDKDRGTTRGDKLTFYIADGRIVVENKEKKRSETVIKS